MLGSQKIIAPCFAHVHFHCSLLFLQLAGVVCALTKRDEHVGVGLLREPTHGRGKEWLLFAEETITGQHDSLGKYMSR